MTLVYHPEDDLYVGLCDATPGGVPCTAKIDFSKGGMAAGAVVPFITRNFGWRLITIKRKGEPVEILACGDCCAAIKRHERAKKAVKEYREYKQSQRAESFIHSNNRPTL